MISSVDMFDILSGISDVLSQYLWYRSSCIQMSDLSYLWYIPVSLMSCLQYLWYLTIAYIWYHFSVPDISLLSSLWYFPRCLFSSTSLDILWHSLDNSLSGSISLDIRSDLLYSVFLFSIVLSHPFMRNKPDTIASHPIHLLKISWKMVHWSGHWNHLFLCFLS